MDTTTPQPSPPPTIDSHETAVPHSAAPVATGPAAVPAVDDTRFFGAHLRMSWWKPLVIIPVLLIAMFVLQLLFTFVVLLVEMAAFGRDPADASISPLMMIAVNLTSRRWARWPCS